ncbi:hypothetical protein DVH24_039477 [Malus domestica]|uniref:PB1-like domain-containing protein n=1 Tax=Malus domestica TaxID=3750 RepID=A0A498HW01_MALDO|nr:hypothetical protein DVH24_039477 [Malus domestica]
MNYKKENKAVDMLDDSNFLFDCVMVGDGKEFYFGGKISYIDGCDKDLMSLLVVDDTVEALGYKEMFMSYYYVIPNMEIFNGLRKIEGDADV